jgi:S1-C subfamily serine protease
MTGLFRYAVLPVLIGFAIALLASSLIFAAQTDPRYPSDQGITEGHKLTLYSIVRIRTQTSGGSGTVLYSKLMPNSGSKYETYVLTNWHVVQTNIKVQTKWSTLLKREVKTDVLSDCMVEFFEFEYQSWEFGHSSYRAQIVCYDKNMDLALLRVKSEKRFDYVVRMFPKGEHKERLRMLMPLYAVGCALGHPTLSTQGQLTGFDDIIENYPYWLSTAPTIFGNSGGAIFLAETYEFIGVPSRIAVILSGFGADAITHMSFFIPITSVYKFLDEQIFKFIYDATITSTECAERRRIKREMDEREIAIRSSREGENGGAEGEKNDGEDKE